MLVWIKSAAVTLGFFAVIGILLWTADAHPWVFTVFAAAVLLGVVTVAVRWLVFGKG